MRINRFVALATGLSRRAADVAIEQGRIAANDQIVSNGYQVKPTDKIKLDGKIITPAKPLTIILNKPVGFVTSRNGQGSKTIYDLLPSEFHNLKPVGRLDKDSSGLLLLTNDGELANQLTHPRYAKEKVYEVILDKPLSATHQTAIETGLMLEDGLSSLKLSGLSDKWTVTISEGRNRQIRRTFSALGYRVNGLDRRVFGEYRLNDLGVGDWQKL